MAKRIFELARELDVSSKDVLTKCRAEGLDIKNHMSSVSVGLEETIREWFSEADEAAAHSAVETTEHVDLEKAREKARKSRRRSRKKKAEEEQPVEAEAENEAPAEAAVAEAPAEQAPPAEAVEEEQPHPVAEAAEEPEPAEQGVEEEPEEEEEEEEDVRPAGPQVVPKPAQLKGPRVVRVEKPDYVPRPQPRAPSPPPPSAPRPGSLKEQRERTEAKKEEDKKRRRRSPRRKGGRSADSGERIKEWRDADLRERSERIAGAGSTLRRRRAQVSRGGGGKTGASGHKTGEVEIEEPITVKSLSAATGIKVADLIKKLMSLGIMATVTQTLETETAETAVADFDITLKVARSKTAEEELMERLEERPKSELKPRAPVVTFLGHVDHGKTSLLDYVRKTAVAEGEAGGITQAIGAYRHDLGDQHVVFLDTPGHEAFTAMRARGANMTDVVVLVVAADDGVMPQTVEAISHAKAAGVPIVVALNKIDVPNANVQRALGQLAEHGLQPQEWGGNTEVIHTSAMTGEGIEELVELLSLEAEILELQAENDAPASGYVVEARMDSSQGVVATLLNLNGTLKVGDVLLAGRGYGRVRQIYDYRGQALEAAGPAMPVAITGLDEVPEAGDRFFCVGDLDEARAVAEQRRREDRTKELAAMRQAPKTLDELIGRIEAGEATDLNLIIKADVSGSIEAIVGSLEKLTTEEVRLNILHTAVGGISTGDVTLAEASDAMIIGFNVVADPQARKAAEAKDIDIRLYRVIYDITEDIRRAMEEGLAPEIREESLGRAEVRQTFKISRVGTIAGCYVTEGLVNRNAKVRIIRDNVVVEDERKLESLKRVKDDVREVKSGLECGIKIAGYDDIKEGDTLEFYQEVEVARSL